jgi:hypothetical protein
VVLTVIVRGVLASVHKDAIAWWWPNASIGCLFTLRMNDLVSQRDKICWTWRHLLPRLIVDILCLRRIVR